MGAGGEACVGYALVVTVENLEAGLPPAALEHRRLTACSNVREAAQHNVRGQSRWADTTSGGVGRRACGPGGGADVDDGTVCRTRTVWTGRASWTRLARACHMRKPSS